MLTSISTQNPITPIHTSSQVSTSSTDFEQAMQAAINNQLDSTTTNTKVETSQPTLLTDADSAKNARPNIKEFMDKTGATFEDASEIVYGVIGSNTDTRNWSAIMNSTDPMTMARQATGLMYNQPTSLTDKTNPSNESMKIVAQSGNFTLNQHHDDEGNITYQGIGLSDSQGNLLRSVGSSAEQIQRNAWLFGFDTQPLQNLIEPAKTMSNDIVTAINMVINTPEKVNTNAQQTNISEAENTAPSNEQTQASIQSISAQLSELSAKLVNNQPTNISTYLNQVTQIQTMMQQLSALEEEAKKVA